MRSQVIIGSVAVLLMAVLVTWNATYLTDDETGDSLSLLSGDEPVARNEPNASEKMQSSPSSSDADDSVNSLTSMVETAAVVVTSDRQNLGRLSIESDADDFVVELTNRSDLPAKVIRTETSCGCTQLGNLNVNPIPPHGSAQIVGKVRMNSAGEQNAFVRIFVEGQRFVPTVQLTWEPLLGVRVAPRSVFFDQILVGETAKREVVVSTTANEDLEKLIESIETKPSEWVSHSMTVNDKKATIAISVRSSDSSGRYQGGLVIRLKGRREPMRVPLEWSVVESLRLEPKSVFKGSVEPESEIRSTFLVRGARELRIGDGAATSEHDVKVSQKTINNGIVCEVICRSPRQPGPFNIRLPMRIIDLDEIPQERTFAVTGIVTSPDERP